MSNSIPALVDRADPRNKVVKFSYKGRDFHLVTEESRQQIAQVGETYTSGFELSIIFIGAPRDPSQSRDVKVKALEDYDHSTDRSYDIIIE